MNRQKFIDALIDNGDSIITRKIKGSIEHIAITADFSTKYVFDKINPNKRVPDKSVQVFDWTNNKHIYVYPNSVKSIRPLSSTLNNEK